MITKKKAYPCQSCKDWDKEKQKCTSTTPITADYCLDDFGKHYCRAHRNIRTGELTGGLKEVQYKEESDKPKVWFTADLHASHRGAIMFHPERLDDFGLNPADYIHGLSEEPFDITSAMDTYDECLIKQWNETIRKGDTVYILGDVCLGNKERGKYIISHLNGKKFLIRGNHDKAMEGLDNYFEWVGDLKEAKFTNNQFKFIDPDETFCVEMCHYPLLTWNRKFHGTACLMGHCHGSLDKFNKESGELRLDVGYDGSFAKENGRFVDLETIYKYFCTIRDAAGCKTFAEYNETLPKRLGYRA